MLRTEVRNLKKEGFTNENIADIIGVEGIPSAKRGVISKMITTDYHYGRIKKKKKYEANRKIKAFREEHFTVKKRDYRRARDKGLVKFVERFYGQASQDFGGKYAIAWLQKSGGEPGYAYYYYKDHKRIVKKLRKNIRGEPFMIRSFESFTYRSSIVAENILRGKNTKYTYMYRKGAKEFQWFEEK